MGKEVQIERALVKAIKDRGGLCFKLINYRGIPDRLVLLPKGRTLFIEVKAPGETPRKDQLLAHKELRQRGFEVWVLDNLEHIEPILEGTWGL